MVTYRSQPSSVTLGPNPDPDPLTIPYTASYLFETITICFSRQLSSDLSMNMMGFRLPVLEILGFKIWPLSPPLPVPRHLPEPRKLHIRRSAVAWAIHCGDSDGRSTSEYVTVYRRFLSTFRLLLEEFRHGIRRFDHRKCAESSVHRHWHYAVELFKIYSRIDVERRICMDMDSGNLWMLWRTHFNISCASMSFGQ